VILYHDHHDASNLAAVPPAARFMKGVRMASRRVALVPDRMTEAQLWDRAATLNHACRFANGRTPSERDRLLEEQARVLVELRLRGTQLTLD
jgi:hypothetical protein